MPGVGREVVTKYQCGEGLVVDQTQERCGDNTETDRPPAERSLRQVRFIFTEN